MQSKYVGPDDLVVPHTWTKNHGVDTQRQAQETFARRDMAKDRANNGNRQNMTFESDNRETTIPKRRHQFEGGNCPKSEIAYDDPFQSQLEE
jgi:hypothetical protein